MSVQGQSQLAGKESRGALFAILLALLICGAAGILSIRLGPDNNWDLRFYHLYAAWAYLHGRYLYDIGPAQAQSYFNPTADLLFYALTSSPLNNAPRIIAFIMGAVHGINAVLTLAIALHVLRPVEPVERLVLCALALLMGVSGAGGISLLGTTTNDLTEAIFVLGSLLGILRFAAAAHARHSWRTLAWSGLSAGIGIGLKYTAAIFLPGLCLIALIAAVRRSAVHALVGFAVATTIGFLLIAGHHLLTLWRIFGNPVFPLFNHIFQSPYFEPQAIRDNRFVVRDLGQLLGYPFYWTRTNIYLVSELAFRDWRGAIAYVSIFAGAIKYIASRVAGHRLLARGETRGLRLVVIFVVTSYLTWCVGFGIYRYAVALEMLTGIVSMGALIWLCEDRRLRLVVAMAVFAIAELTTVYPDWGRGANPSAGIRPARYGDKYVDVRVPALPANSLVLIPTPEPVAYFIPFATPSARYLGIENNFLNLSQSNDLADGVKRLMRKPGAPKFVVNVGEFNSDRLNGLLARFGLRLDGGFCEPIRSNLEEHALSLCRIIDN